MLGKYFTQINLGSSTKFKNKQNFIFRFEKVYILSTDLSSKANVKLMKMNKDVNLFFTKTHAFALPVIVM